MTALNQYQRLESPGIWRAAPEAQRRDVFVSIGDATLVIYDAANRALAHWSLPAVERINPGTRPAVYRPGPDAPEDLEIAEPEMIDAIETVRRTIERRRPREGRLRLVLLGVGLAAVVGLGAFWLPDALVRHAASVVPAAKRAELGERLLAQMRRVAGAPCETAQGRRALGQLHRRLSADRGGRIVVLSGGIAETAHLPGGLILVHRSLVEDHETPDVVAGYVLAEAVRAGRDPVERLLDTLGPLSALRLLATGDVPDDALALYTEALLSHRAPPVDDQTLLSRFRAASVAATPYAYARDISGETTLALIEADPAAGGGATPVLPDSAWVALQGICGE